MSLSNDDIVRLLSGIEKIVESKIRSVLGEYGFSKTTVNSVTKSSPVISPKETPNKASKETPNKASKETPNKASKETPKKIHIGKHDELPPIMERNWNDTINQCYCHARMWWHNNDGERYAFGQCSTKKMSGSDFCKRHQSPDKRKEGIMGEYPPDGSYIHKLLSGQMKRSKKAAPSYEWARHQLDDDGDVSLYSQSNHSNKSTPKLSPVNNQEKSSKSTPKITPKVTPNEVIHVPDIVTNNTPIVHKHDIEINDDNENDDELDDEYGFDSMVGLYSCEEDLRQDPRVKMIT